MGKVLNILIQPCLPDDERFEDWSQAAAAALTAQTGSPERETAVAQLREMGFAVLEPNQPSDSPPAAAGQLQADAGQEPAARPEPPAH